MSDKKGVLVVHDELPELVELFGCVFGYPEHDYQGLFIHMLQGGYEDGSFTPLNWDLEMINDGYNEKSARYVLSLLKNLADYLRATCEYKSFTIISVDVFSEELDTILLYIDNEERK